MRTGHLIGILALLALGGCQSLPPLVSDRGDAALAGAPATYAFARTGDEEAMTTADAEAGVRQGLRIWGLTEAPAAEAHYQVLVALTHVPPGVGAGMAGTPDLAWVTPPGAKPNWPNHPQAMTRLTVAFIVTSTGQEVYRRAVTAPTGTGTKVISLSALTDLALSRPGLNLPRLTAGSR